ncbi:MAG: TonB-dependent receptor [Mucilaginibacter sp.]|uniref:TonB-dependent receptor n=1 Tax=Mucilaginibacter sp. TaxID=1882438 RepID=UPI0031B1E54C
MNKLLLKKIKLFFVLILITGYAHAQGIKIGGIVADGNTKTPIYSAVIKIKGSAIETASNQSGHFSIIAPKQGSVTITVSFIGYQTVQQTLSSDSQELNILLTPSTIFGQEVVIAASRTPERLLESPVSIERISGASIKETPGLSFYDALSNLKGVETTNQSLTFKSVNTRGFNADGNYRFNQFVDGMDNMAPGLNFNIGNIVGISDLDLDNAELLPGASSALYGSGGTNGTLIMTSKDPFKYQGISFQYKTGINHVSDDNSGVKPFNQVDVRLAKSWNNRFGVKVSFSYLRAHDWIADNTSNYDRIGKNVKAGNRNTDPNYDGVNVYGDEVSQNMRNVAQAVLNAGQQAYMNQYSQATGGMIPSQSQINSFLMSNDQTAPFYAGLNTPGLLPNESVSRTGYDERSLVNYDANSLKTSTALYYKFTNTIQAIAQVNWGRGSTMYTNSDRYALQNFSIGQYKLELKGEDFLARAYTVQERSGDSYITSILGSYINEQSKASQEWFPEYVANYIGAKAQQGLSDADAHAAARAAADNGRFLPGSATFNAAKNTIINNTISEGTGARFDDKTNMYHYEGMYNFNRLLNNIFELQAGASYRVYQLRSNGTIFDDVNRKLNIGEFGSYAIIGKKFFDDRLKLTLAGRYDKNENFDGRFTPRATAVYALSDNNHIRASYQTGYRNPASQNQYLDLAAGGGSIRLIGGLPEMLNKYQLLNNKPFTGDSYYNFLGSAAAGKPDQSLLKVYNFNPKGIQPESVKAFELGDKALITPDLLFDAYVYYNEYKNFISEIEVYQNHENDFTSFNVPVNVAGTVKEYGAAAGLDYHRGAYVISGNVSYNNINKLPADYVNDYGFNSPKFRFNLGLANPNVYHNIGFNIAYRWQQQFKWSTPFAAGDVPAFGTVDAQVNLKIPVIKSMIKVGGSNILNKYYHTSFGDPAFGGLYYISLGYNL